mgnify:CR=1 FL=1
MFYDFEYSILTLPKDPHEWMPLFSHMKLLSYSVIEIEGIGFENSLFVAGLCVFSYSYRDDRGE